MLLDRVPAGLPAESELDVRGTEHELADDDLTTGRNHVRR